MNHLDLFTGYGGFTISAQRNNIKTVYHAEIDKYANAVLKYRFPNIPNLGDVSKIDTSKLSDIDIITGGTPCQDLSVAGKGAGLDGERSGLFFHFIRILRDVQPSYFVWENVKGAFSSNKGWDFARVQIEMAQAGYSVQWVVLNAKDYGIPQNRERIFAIGTKDRCAREVLRIAEGSGQNLKELTEKVSDAERVYDNSMARSQKALGGRLGAKTGLYAVPLKFLNRNGKQLPDNYTYTVDTAHTGGVLQGKRIRRLMPVECERLMGLEDNWTAMGIIDGKEVDISDTQRYKMCGNGVVVNCVDICFRAFKP